jgi:hypothetical protein
LPAAVVVAVGGELGGGCDGVIASASRSPRTRSPHHNQDRNNPPTIPSPRPPRPRKPPERGRFHTCNVANHEDTVIVNFSEPPDLTGL